MCVCVCVCVCVSSENVQWVRFPTESWHANLRMDSWTQVTSLAPADPAFMLALQVWVPDLTRDKPGPVAQESMMVAPAD